MPRKKDIRIVVTISETEIKVTYSDWIKLNPRILDRVRVMMGKAWRKERANVVHLDRVKKTEAARLAESESV